MNQKECNGYFTAMFIQIGCVIPQAQVVDRRVYGLAVGCFCVFLALFSINFLDYIAKDQENQYIAWDVKTITSGDYTVEFDIPPAFFERWVDKHYLKFIGKQHRESGKCYVAKVDAFRDWITMEMERRLDLLPDLGYEDEPVEHVKIALTSFAFRNAETI